MEKPKRFLNKPRIIPQKPKLKDINISDLIDYYSSSGAYNGGRLVEACEIFENMIQQDATVCLTLSGALTPAGIGGFIIQMIKNGIIDFIISTGANLYHDLHFALDLPVYQGDFRVDDSELLKNEIVRIYDIFIPNDTLIKTDKFVRDAANQFLPKNAISSAEFHNHIGKKIWDVGKKPNYSIMAIAAKYKVPIYTPSPGDSSLGMNLALLKIENKKLIIDTDLDVLETTAIIYNSKKTGAVELGGGAPKNFYMQTQPMLSQIMNIETVGHDYFIQITADAPHWGGLSGATPSEAVSWKKIKPNDLKNNVVVYCDVTIAAPIIFTHILSKNYIRPFKNLYDRRQEFLDSLNKAYSNK
jgi:deoxyhypusine synthase